MLNTASMLPTNLNSISRWPVTKIAVGVLILFVNGLLSACFTQRAQIHLGITAGPLVSASLKKCRQRGTISELTRALFSSNTARVPCSLDYKPLFASSIL